MKFNIYGLALGLLLAGFVYAGGISGRIYEIPHKELVKQNSSKILQKSEFDFLDKKYKASFWFSSLPRDIKINAISAEINNKELGFIRISFYPKNAAASKIIDSLYSANRKNLVSYDQFELPDVARKLQENENFNIWAFYTDKNSVIKESDLHQIVYLPNFPCKVFLYKRNNSSWTLRNTLTINNWTEYMKLFSSEILAN